MSVPGRPSLSGSLGFGTGGFFCPLNECLVGWLLPRRSFSRLCGIRDGFGLRDTFLYYRCEQLYL